MNKKKAKPFQGTVLDVEMLGQHNFIWVKNHKDKAIQPLLIDSAENIFKKGDLTFYKIG